MKNKLIKEFSLFENCMDRYQYIIDLGKNLPKFPNEWKIQKYVIEGCQSNVWIHHTYNIKKIHFNGISDSSIVSGLIAILMQIYNDCTPNEIIAIPHNIIESIGINQHLSIKRNNGLHAMLKYIYATAYKYNNIKL
ncbi:Cysteine desulfuration protein SufE [Candidatus Johnevansia muelleri]|uniref:Cysteine desulfuration protein SufE n=1 Tax=Candidatus Johnevansia muelleri TaxID=1495769 RepID=A0A078KB71_9GAMM|nr:Cysteine desulfuration protein SufE [Candidatus Evansia muelleri]